MNNSIPEERKAHDWPCKKYGTKDVWYTVGETYDGSYDIHYYHCHHCQHEWRVVLETD